MSSARRRACSSAAGRSTILDMLLLVLSISSLASAQTFTKCNPTNATCPKDPALSTNATFNFADRSADPKLWDMSNGAIDFNSDAGAVFKIQDDGQSPKIVSLFYIFFGRVETVMQAATGSGIISSIMLLSDDLDEIDWEVIGNNGTSAQSNYYGKGDSVPFPRMEFHETPDKSPQSDFYNYTTVWTSDKIEWWLNGTLVRTLNAGDPQKINATFPQTPMFVSIGPWPAGKPGSPKGQVAWAGGPTDFSHNPTYTMTVKSVYVEDFGGGNGPSSSGKAYWYGDRSGTWQSIKTDAGESPVAKYVWKPHGVQGRWNALPKGAQIGIIAGVLGTVAVLALLMVFCCIKQRRAGRKERQIADAEFEKGAAELMDYRRKMAAGAFGHGSSNIVGSPRLVGKPTPAYGGGQQPKLPSVHIMEAGRPMKSGWL